MVSDSGRNILDFVDPLLLAHIASGLRTLFALRGQYRKNSLRNNFRRSKEV